MPLRIEDYAVIGDTHTVALVARNGSIDWLCVPRFDSGAVFAALLGDDDHGFWKLAPAGGVRSIERSYRDDTLVLETEFTTDDGVVRIVDCMPIRGKNVVEVVRIVEGVSGRVPIHMDLRIRFDYGANLPWVVEIDGRLHATAGPSVSNGNVLSTPSGTTTTVAPGGISASGSASRTSRCSTPRCCTRRGWCWRCSSAACGAPIC